MSFHSILKSVSLAMIALGMVSVARVHAGGEKIPKGAEKAVAAVREAHPKAEIDEVSEPKGFGSSGGKGTPMFWSIRFHVGDKKHELSVIPEGTIIRFPSSAEVKDLPKAVADAVAKAAPGAAVQGAEKNEMRATMKYVAIDKAQVRQYAIDVVKDGKKSRITMNPDGSGAKVKELKQEPVGKEKKPEAPKEIDIPEKAAIAVKAIKALYKDAVVKQMTTEVFDGGSGTVDILTYEIEFVSKGKMHEMVASPEGFIPHLWAAIDIKTLPKAVTMAIEKAIPEANIEQAKAHEIRGSLRFATLEKPRIYYTVRVESDGTTRTIQVKPDGELVKRAEFPKKKTK